MSAVGNSPLGGPPLGNSPVGSVEAVPRRRAEFAAGAAAGLLGVLGLAWLTGLRAVLHTLLLTLAAVALLPFVLIVAAIAVFAVAGLIAGLVAQEDIGAAAAADGIAGGDSRFAKFYYRFAWRQRRHPVAWGLGAGLGLGVLGVWLALAKLVVPLEAQTLSILLRSQARIEALKSSPEPAADGLLRPSLWDDALATDAPVLDAFGRPIRYARQGAWLASSYTLSSLGYDGEQSADDLCVRGQSALARTLDRIDALRFLEDLYAGKLGWSERAEALTQTRCDGGG